MSIRLDPRRLGTLKQLAAEAGVRPGDLVRQWVEERIDGERRGAPAASGPDFLSLLESLTARVEALERGATAQQDEPVALEVSPMPGADEAPVTDEAVATEPDPDQSGPAVARRRRNAVSATPTAPRVALHDEMIAVLRERGPLTAAELAGAIAERGRYAPPRSGKPLDAAMVSQRVSNPTYRSRFVRNEGRIGLAE
jgi:hypothetical protein